MGITHLPASSEMNASMWSRLDAMACVLLNCASNHGCMELVSPSLANCVIAMQLSWTELADPVAAFSMRPSTVGLRCVGAK